MRPKSIINFERLYLGALAIGLVNILLSWQQGMGLLNNNPDTRSLGQGVVYVSIFIGFLVPLLLWYFTARRASVVAKWIVVILFALGLISLLVNFQRAGLPTGVSGILALVALVMQAAAIWMLFRPDAKAWFSDGRGDVDPNTFR